MDIDISGIKSSLDSLFDRETDKGFGLKILSLDELKRVINPLVDSYASKSGNKEQIERDVLERAKNYLIGIGWVEATLEGKEGEYLTAR